MDGNCEATVAPNRRNGDIATRLTQRYGDARKMIATQNVDARAARRGPCDAKHEMQCERGESMRAVRARQETNVQRQAR
jgi:hypothetical protein